MKNELIRALIAGARTMTLFPAPIRLPQVSDAQSLRGDWQRVGGDLRTAMNKHGPRT